LHKTVSKLLNINKLERYQRRFTKRIQGLYNTNYFDRLAQLGLESLQSRRLKYDLVTCYKITHHNITTRVQIQSIVLEG